MQWLHAGKHIYEEAIEVCGVLFLYFLPEMILGSPFITLKEATNKKREGEE